jgi:tetratricopeptide (TPR) repeat protein
MAQLRMFVSHSSTDRPFADALVTALRQAGANVWYDEHNLGAGLLSNNIQAELSARPVFLVLLSPAAFASEWVRLETGWAWNLYRREPQRILLPVVASAIIPSAFNGPWLFLEDFKRIEGLDHQPYPQPEAITRTLQHLGLTPAGQTAPARGEDVDSLIARGKALVAQQRYDQAVPFFQVATVLDTSSFDAWFNLGYAQRHLGHHQDALAAYEQVLVIRPSSVANWYNKGNALHRLDRYEEALAAYDRVLALNPNHVNACYNKGNALRNLQRYEEALVAYDRALALDAKYVPTYRKKAITLRALGRIAEAEKAERRAKELSG